MDTFKGSRKLPFFCPIFPIARFTSDVDRNYGHFYLIKRTPQLLRLTTKQATNMLVHGFLAHSTLPLQITVVLLNPLFN